MAEAVPAVELTGILKRFPGVVANWDVNLRVEQGDIHAIAGQVASDAPELVGLGVVETLANFLGPIFGLLVVQVDGDTHHLHEGVLAAHDPQLGAEVGPNSCRNSWLLTYWQ